MTTTAVTSPEFDLVGATASLRRAIDQNYSFSERIAILCFGQPSVKVDDARKCLKYLPDAADAVKGLPDDLQALPVYLQFGRLEMGIEVTKDALKTNDIDPARKQMIVDLLDRMKSD